MVEIRELNYADDDEVRGYYDSYVAAERTGNPDATVHSYAETVASLRGPSAGWAFRVVVAVMPVTTDPVTTDLPGGIVGGAMCIGSTLDNLHAAWIAVHVRPEHRSSGVGSALLEAIEDRAAADGRTELSAEVILGGGRSDADRGFAERHGYRWNYSEVERRLDLPLSPELLDRLDADTRAHRDGYRIVAFDGPVPDEWAAGYCEVGNRLSADSPHGDQQVEERRRTTEELREQEEQISASGRHRLTALALDERTAAVAALCTCVVSEAGGEAVNQWATIVDRGHRGHRLGMAVKVACYRLLSQFAADKLYVTTGNAETNRWMIAINADLGFEVHSTIGVFLKRD